MGSNKPVIAIDGLSASGKGTLAKRLADRLDFAYLDTGMLYRAAGLMAKEAGVDLDDQKALAAFAEHLDIKTLMEKTGSPNLRSDEAAQCASKAGANPLLRAALLKFQQNFARTPPDGKKGVVLDGRDIGTVIAPDATVKIFVTASIEKRANRRFKELQAAGENVSEAAVLADMLLRDERDSTRDVAPTKPAPDAVILDTTDMDAEAAFTAALAIVETRLGNA